MTPLAAQSGGEGLSVRVGDAWLAWPASAAPPARWEGPDPLMTRAVRWRSASAGVEWGELTLRGGHALWRVRVVLVRLDPALLSFRMVVPPSRDDGFSGRWSVDEAPAEAVMAVNAGQFTSGPWGWLVAGGALRQGPGTGALAPGVAFGGDGRVTLVPRDSLDALEDVTEGFQSYPAILEGDGQVPLPLRRPGLGVDLTHRDARLAFGLLRDGRIVLALTRYEGLGGMLEAAPFGPTTPEMAALMGALGCARAVLLDGGLSGQLMVRTPEGTRAWPGLRRVAAGLVAVPRSPPRDAGGRHGLQVKQVERP